MSPGWMHNGLLLSALWNAAFDQGLVTFDDQASRSFYAASAKQPRLNCAGKSPPPSHPNTKPIWSGTTKLLCPGARVE